ncbi:MAG: alpha/beta hydrolase [Saprospiraceae bacterium]
MPFKFFTFLLCLFFCNNTFAQKEVPKKPFVIGEIVELQSDILNEKRTLNIYLPEGYHPDSAATYSVIYLLDGSADEDFIHIAGMVQFANFPWVELLPKSIVVGIANVDRKRDFTYPTLVTEIKEAFPTSGKSVNFINFLSKELQPFIDKNYKTNSTKLLLGQSLGGLVATEILFKQPDLFSHYIIISPSLWWDDQTLLKVEPVFLKPDFQKELSIFIGVGNEDKYKVMETDARALFTILEKEKKENVKTHFQFFENLTHGDILHLAVYEAFKVLFKKEEK